MPESNADAVRRVLAVVAHGDDEVIGCGGRLIQATDAGAEVTVSIACLADAGRLAEATAAAGVMGTRLIHHEHPEGQLWIDERRAAMRAHVRQLVQDLRPHEVVTHDPEEDANPDHRALAEDVLIALELATHGTAGWRVEDVRTFETNALFTFPAEIRDVTDVWPRVVEALACYPSQTEAEHKHGYYQALIETRSRLRGVQGGAERGEAYQRHAIPVMGQFSGRTALPGPRR